MGFLGELPLLVTGELLHVEDRSSDGDCPVNWNGVLSDTCERTRTSGGPAPEASTCYAALTGTRILQKTRQRNRTQRSRNS